jgi:hypothetical protein
MKIPFSQHICPEYHFNFGPLGVQQIVPSLPDGEQNFSRQEYFADYGRIAGAFAHRLSDCRPIFTETRSPSSERFGLSQKKNSIEHGRS